MLSERTENQKLAKIAADYQIKEGGERVKLQAYNPYPFQARFHEARDSTGVAGTAKFRLIEAGNQVGKTYCASAEVAMHLTGQYPSWWKGFRFDDPVKVGCAAGSHEDVKRLAQVKLLGGAIDGDEWGKGYIPVDCFGKIERSRSVPGCVKEIHIKHISGEWSQLKLLSYERHKDFEGEEFALLWLDEEPEPAVMSRVLARGVVPLAEDRGGLVIVSMTPEKGITPFLREFSQELLNRPHYARYTATWHDALHFIDKKTGEFKHSIRLMLAGVPPAMKAKMVFGKPMEDSGLVFDIGPEEYVRSEFSLMTVPQHWKQIIGMDFGFCHPTAMVWIAINPAGGDMFCYDEYRESKKIPSQIYIELSRHGEMPIAWPHDGNKTGSNDGISTIMTYKELGIGTFLGRPFSNPTGGNSVEAGLRVIFEYLKRGKLQISSRCSMLLDEMSQYSRKEGKVLAEKEDLCSALRYAVLSAERFATPVGRLRHKKPQSYVPKGYNPCSIKI